MGRAVVAIYKSGTRIYQLTNDKGNIYTMHSFCQGIDQNLQISDLQNLGKRLKMPHGWSFDSYVLENDLKIECGVDGAVVIDELMNTYFRK
jgi:hypothetical protein